MPKTRPVTIQFHVSVPKNISDDEACRLVKMMLDAGLNDAWETTQDPDIDSADAHNAMCLKIGDPEVVGFS